MLLSSIGVVVLIAAGVFIGLFANNVPSNSYVKVFDSSNIKKDSLEFDFKKNITLDIDIKPYFAAKNFLIKLTADKQQKECNIE